MTSKSDGAPARVDLAGPTRATYRTFIAHGFVMSTWASRIPQVKAQLGLDASGLGLLLLAVAAGSVVAVPLAGTVISRRGPRRTVELAALISSASLATVGVGMRLNVTVVAGGLFAFGVAMGTWDVAMNVHGTRVEQASERPILSRFHAGYSVGTVAGALVGVGVVAAGVSVTVHLLVVAAAEAVVLQAVVRGFFAQPPAALSPQKTGQQPKRRRLEAWREQRTVLIGVVVLAFALAEGTGNDWVSVAVIEDHRAAPAIGTLALAVFLAAMAATRWVGPGLLQRHGRVAMLRATAVCAIVGLAVFALAPDTAVACVGALLWGIGASLGFPVGMSAGADDPTRAAPRVSVIASIGYCAFLGGPPLIGFVAQHITIAHAVLVPAAVLAMVSLLLGVVRPADSVDRDGRQRRG
jgi:fucose permease